jgi:hypothetical protein
MDLIYMSSPTNSFDVSENVFFHSLFILSLYDLMLSASLTFHDSVFGN